ncbi:SDR family NAD(P)-dependent oxidoreductase [Zhihengliuella halotolerans]|uniref:SDR family NAD(P)-dependent oxidoreductase n=1 Tax=Zhihengliuella halotolerans TaxID=370736 RepID=UPI000C7FA09E|nr:3-oxoacyl-ACP reductase family protein [Zhihengliuella halotolerans]
MSHEPTPELTGRTALVTGAASGIGRGIAHELATRGASVVVLDINDEAGDDAAAHLPRVGGARHSALATDVTDRASVDAAVATAREEHGRIDVLVNNAGWDKVGPFVDTDPALWEKIIGISLYGTLNLCHAVAPVMAEQRAADESFSGRIVNIASDAGRVGSTGEAVYSAAKGGVIAFTKTLAREIARHQVTVNCVCPGPADTPLFDSISADSPKLREALIKAIPLRRLATPEDLASAVAFFASPAAGYVTGQTLSVSGGLTMA